MDEFQRFLFLLGLTTAHELVHVFVSYLTGNSTSDTPPAVQYPPRASSAGAPQSGGESGNTWEGKLMGCIVLAYFNRTNSRGPRQAGDLYALQNRVTPYRLSPEWIRKCLELG